MDEDDMYWLSMMLPDEEEDEGAHTYDCCCEDCLQNHPERDVLYNDFAYYGLPDD